MDEHRAGGRSDTKDNRRAVLLLTQPFDFAVDPVIEKFDERGVEVIRFDTGWFPRDATLSGRIDADADGWEATIVTSEGRDVDLSRVGSIWYRRPRDFSFADDLDPGAVQFARGEALAGLGGMLRSVDCQWVSHPEKIVSADYKPYQLAVATRMGWTVPRTIITNDPKAAEQFVNENKASGVIYKNMGGSTMYIVDGELSALYAKSVTVDELAGIATIRYTPCLLQERVQRGFDLRITVVGDRVFSVAIRNSDADEVDWRRKYQNLTYSVYDLPAQVRDRCVDLVRSLGLMFGAIDVIYSAQDEYVFLEVNANGQWHWLEVETGVPISEAMADCLAPYSASDRRA
jgi:ATP-grasp ribosomal peptide maturase